MRRWTRQTRITPAVFGLRAQSNLPSHVLCCMYKLRSTFWDVLFFIVACVMNRKHFPHPKCLSLLELLIFNFSWRMLVIVCTLWQTVDWQQLVDFIYLRKHWWSMTTIELWPDKLFHSLNFKQAYTIYMMHNECFSDLSVTVAKSKTNSPKNTN